MQLANKGVCVILQVAVKVANGMRTYSHDGSYQYDYFLQVEWRAHQRFSLHGAPCTGFPDILAAGAAPNLTQFDLAPLAVRRRPPHHLMFD